MHKDIIDFALDTVKLIREFILADPDLRNDRDKFIEGWGWDHTKWTPEQWPKAVRLYYPLGKQRSLMGAAG